MGQLVSIHRYIFTSQTRLRLATPYLKHWSNSSTTSNHSNGAAHVGSVAEMALGSANIDLISNGELVDHSRDISLWIGLNRTDIRAQVHER